MHCAKIILRKNTLAVRIVVAQNFQSVFQIPQPYGFESSTYRKKSNLVYSFCKFFENAKVNLGQIIM